MKSRSFAKSKRAALKKSFLVDSIKNSWNLLIKELKEWEKLNETPILLDFKN